MKLHNPRGVRVRLVVTWWGWFHLLKILWAMFWFVTLLAASFYHASKGGWGWFTFAVLGVAAWLWNLRRYISESWTEYDERRAEAQAIRDALAKRDDDREV